MSFEEICCCSHGRSVVKEDLGSGAYGCRVFPCGCFWLSFKSYSRTSKNLSMGDLTRSIYAMYLRVFWW